MNGEVSGRTLRSRSRDTSVAKVDSKVTRAKKSVSYEESVIIKTSAKNSSYVSPSFDENGLINKESKESMNKSIRETRDADNESKNVYDSGGINKKREILDSGGGYSSDDSIDSPWQNGQFKSPEEVLSYYKRFGDWWNYFPKTDYAYNRTSKWYGKEVAPGIPVIPNMARPPLHPENLFKHYKTSESSSRNLARDRMFEKLNGAAYFSTSNSIIKNFFYKIISVITTVITTILTCITSVTSVVSFRSSNDTVIKSAQLVKDDVIERDSFWNKIFRWLYRFSSWLLVKEVLIFSSIHYLFSKDKSRKKSRILKFLLLLLIPLILGILGYYTLNDSNNSLVEDYVFTLDSLDFSKYYYGIIDYFKLVTDYLADTWWYLYALLPAYSQLSFSVYSKNPSVVTSPQGNIDSEQLNYMVEQMVRETIKKDSAILLEDIVSHPRFKSLIEKAVIDKTDSWDPSSLLASEQWKITIKQVVEDHYSQNFNKDDIEGRIVKNVEERFDSKFSELKESSNKLEEKFLALEKDMFFLIQQFVTHQQLDDAIRNLTKHLYADSKLDEKVLIEKVKSEVTVKIQEDVNSLFKTLLQNKHQVEDIKGDIDLDQVKEYVRLMIERAIALYDADKIGIVDYALESSGGIVVSTRCTESYSGGQATYKLFGIALWKRSNSPRTVIQPSVHPGECWAFAGQQGYIVIELSATIIVTAFTLEHIPRSLAPQERIDSAPKDFSVWGLKYETDEDRTFLGRFRFIENGTSLQKFQATPQEEPFRLVELIIESNHGNLEYTCLYRFRVHGVPVS